jgi:hypothetical protein
MTGIANLNSVTSDYESISLDRNLDDDLRHAQHLDSYAFVLWN